VEASRQKDLQDRIKFGCLVDWLLSDLGVPLIQPLPGALGDQIVLLLGVVKDRELSNAREVVHRVLAMFDSHYRIWTTQR
jgi:hypothetical protein